MSNIANQPLANPLNLSDLLAVWSSDNGDTRRASITTLLALLQANIVTPAAAADTPIFLPFVGGTNDIIASAAVGVTVPAYYLGQAFIWFATGNNTGPMTINVAGHGVVDLRINNRACTGGESIIGAPGLIVFDGVRFQFVAGQSGHVVQRAYAEYTANADLTVVIPSDDTIPQITEGTEIVTVTITPISAANRIRYRWSGFGASAGGFPIVSALFQDATANALSASEDNDSVTNVPIPLYLEGEVAAASVTARTYRIRVGPGAADTIRLNGLSAARRFGGVARAVLIVEEIVP